MSDQLDDKRLDREIRAYLAWRTERVIKAPSAAEMALRVGGRALSPRLNWTTSRVGWVVVAALLALALVGVLLVGGGIRPFVAEATLAPTDPRAVGAVPMNGWIAFSTRAHDAENGVQGEIFLARAGEPAQRLAGGTAETICPQFSPDGRKLSYVEGDDLVVLGGDPPHEMREVYRSVAVGRTAGACPIWSPSSQTIALLAGDAIALRGLDGAERTIAVSAPVDHFERMFFNYNPLAWAPDGSAIAYAATDGIWLVDVDESSSQRLSEVQSGSVSWSADGARLAFADASVADGNITVQTIAAPSEVVVVGQGEQFAWAPFADEIAFPSDGGIVIVKADGSGSRVVRPATGYGFGGWSPMGDYLLEMRDVSGASYDLIAISTTGGTNFRIAIGIQTGGSLNFPDMGDVSWQAVYP